jgi:CDP-diacylglycerol--inositol 3-phosphatidyltransferase
MENILTQLLRDIIIVRCVANVMLKFVLYISRSLLQGKTSHKFVDLSGNPIMRIYYTSRPVLFFMCAGNEAFYAALYLLHFTEGPVGMYFTNRNGI